MSTPIIFKKYTKLQTPLATIISTDIKSIFPSHKCWLCLTTTKNESILLFFSSPRMMTLHYISICLSHCSIFLSPIFRKLFFVQIRSKNNLNWVDKDFFSFLARNVCDQTLYLRRGGLNSSIDLCAFVFVILQNVREIYCVSCSVD